MLIALPNADGSFEFSRLTPGEYVLQAATTAVTSGVANIRQDIADLKAANPGVDTTAREASVGRLEAEVTDVTELDSENPAAP